MTTVVYQGWLTEWDHKLQQKTPTQRILLLQDKFSGHVVSDGLQGIHVEIFQPNLTAHVQPNDAGIIWCFKAHYCHHFCSRAIDCYKQGITPSDVYVINQLEAMHLAGPAWNEVDTTMIQNCWHKAGILPSSACLPTITSLISVPVSMLVNTPTHVLDSIPQAEEGVKSTLEELQSLSILQQSN